jgi:hypothetical protein
MLSVVDLVEAGTLSLQRAAWLLGRIADGTSWLVGARPGGAGKTTVMSALLGMLPSRARVILTNAGTGWEQAGPDDCVVCYEISPGFYDAYLWGGNVRKLTELGRSGCRIVSNLHADTLAEAREQVVGQCGAAEQAFGSFGLFIPLKTGGRSWRGPRVDALHEYRGGQWVELRGEPVADERVTAAERFLEHCIGRSIRRVEQVRAAWLNLPLSSGTTHR